MMVTFLDVYLCFTCRFDPCVWFLQDEGHSDWASCVRFSPNTANPIIVSCGWDKMVKVGVLPVILR